MFFLFVCGIITFFFCFVGALGCVVALCNVVFCTSRPLLRSSSKIQCTVLILLTAYSVCSLILWKRQRQKELLTQQFYQILSVSNITTRRYFWKHFLPYFQSCRMSKIRRKVTVENSKTISDSSSSSSTTTSSTANPTTPSRRPSVFERLGPSTGSNAADVCIAQTWKFFQFSADTNLNFQHTLKKSVFVLIFKESDACSKSNWSIIVFVFEFL